MPQAYKIFKFTDFMVSLFLFVIKGWGLPPRKKQSLGLKIYLINVKKSAGECECVRLFTKEIFFCATFPASDF